MPTEPRPGHTPMEPTSTGPRASEQMPAEPNAHGTDAHAHRVDVNFVPKVNVSGFRNALHECRLHLNARFWQRFHDELCEHAYDERCQRLNVQIRNMWPEVVSKPGIRKLMSHFGAIRAHEGMKGWKTYDSSRQAYMDVGNHVYSYVLGKVWKLPDGLTSCETLGDLVECFLGMCYFMQHPDNVARSECHHQLYVLKNVEAVISYVYDSWDDRDNIDFSL